METQSSNKEVNNHVEGKSSRLRCGDLVLRVLVLGLTLVAAILLGVDKQSKVVPVVLVPTLPPLDVPVTAKWHYLSAFLFFVVANSIACTYAAVSLVLILASKGKNKGLAMMITIFDLVMVGLLFSCNGAAAAIGVVGYEGNSHVQWNKVCNVFGRFCHQVLAAVVLSLLSSVGFMWLVAVSVLNLHKKNK